MNRPFVMLWDPLIRVFHWSLVIIVASNYAINETGEIWHRALGGTALGLLIVRFIWGFMAKGAARWSDFFPTPKRLWQHSAALLQGKNYRRMGHTPIGALVMIIMMLCIFALGITGMMMSLTDAFVLEDWLAELHSLLADTLVIVVAVHVLAAIVESLRLKENLPLSIVTGKREQRDE